MKNPLTLFLIFASFWAISQKNSFTPYYNVGEPWQFQKLSFYGNDNVRKMQDSLIAKYNIKVRNTFAKNKKGETVLTKKMIYDGQNSQIALSNLRSRKMNYKSFHKINNYRIYEWKYWGSRQKQINEYLTINGKEFLKEKTYFTKNKTKGRTQYFWNKEGVLDSMRYFKKRDTKPASSTHYFYQNEKLAETKTYKNGKLTTVRKYDCTPLGEVQKKVKQTKSCVNTEFDKDGNKITVNEYTDEKGRTRKWKTTYFGDSKIVLKNEGFDFKNRRTYLEETTPTKQTYIYYKNGLFSKGKESFKKVSHFDSQENLIKSESYYNGKLSDTRIYTYNTNNLLLSQVNLNKKGKETYNITFEYNSQGLKIKETRRYKKKTYTSTYIYE
ncbi:MAG: hypothetical protein ABF242_10365 [Flavobacteriales bacterium]